MSDILRLHNTDVPKEFPARIPLFEKEFKIDARVLYDLLELKANPKKVVRQRSDRLARARLPAHRQRAGLD